MKIVVSIVSISFLLFFATLPIAHAAKPRVRKTAATTASTAYSSAKLSRATNSIILTSKNLSNVTKVSYELSYLANGVSQGAMGSIAVNGQTTDTRDIYFGTCSHGVCTPHANIKQATLTVRTHLSSGKTHVKLYRIKL